MLLNRIKKYLNESITDEPEEEEQSVNMKGIEEIDDHPAWNMRKFDMIGSNWPSYKEVAEKYNIDIKKASNIIDWCYNVVNDMMYDDINEILTYNLNKDKVRTDYRGNWLYVKDWWIEDFKEKDVRIYHQIAKDFEVLGKGLNDADFVYDTIDGNNFLER